MTPAQMTDLVEAYFDAVDRMHLADTLALFVPDAQFHIPTHGLHFKGRDGEIAGMYERLFARYAQVWHGDFDHVVQGPNRIASRAAPSATKARRRGAISKRRPKPSVRKPGRISRIAVPTMGPATDLRPPRTT